MDIKPEDKKCIDTSYTKQRFEPGTTIYYLPYDKKNEVFAFAGTPTSLRLITGMKIVKREVVPPNTYIIKRQDKPSKVAVNIKFGEVQATDVDICTVPQTYIAASMHSETWALDRQHLVEILRPFFQQNPSACGEVKLVQDDQKHFGPLEIAASDLEATIQAFDAGTGLQAIPARVKSTISFVAIKPTGAGKRKRAQPDAEPAEDPRPDAIPAAIVLRSELGWKSRH